MTTLQQPSEDAIQLLRDELCEEEEVEEVEAIRMLVDQLEDRLRIARAQQEQIINENKRLVWERDCYQAQYNQQASEDASLQDRVQVLEGQLTFARTDVENLEAWKNEREQRIWLARDKLREFYALRDFFNDLPWWRFRARQRLARRAEQKIDEIAEALEPPK